MDLKYYVVRRLLLIIPTFIGLVLIVFLLMRSIPNAELVAPYLNNKSSIPLATQIKNAEVLLGIRFPDGAFVPVPLEFFYYLKDIFIGQWGQMSITGYYTGSVLNAISLYAPNTIQLALVSTVVAILIAIPLGTYIGSRPDSFADQAGRIFSLTGYAMPAFWLALLLQIAFGKGVIAGNPVGVLPISLPYAIHGTFPSWINASTGQSYPTHIMVIDSLIHGDFALTLSAIEHLILPVATLTYGILAGLLRFIRAGMVDSSNQEYVKTARMKGVSERVVIKRHIRKNGLLPTVTVVGLLFASLLTGVVLIEDVFNYKGLGLLAYESVYYHSLYGTLGTTIMFGIILMAANLIVDIVYAFLDPRIRY